MKTENFKCGSILLTGFANAGKSTLLNCIIKKKISIVSPKVQTTKDEISGIINIKKTQLVLTDTPGIIENTKFNEKQISRVLLNQERKIDYNLFIFDLKKKLNKKLLNLILTVTKRFPKNFLVLNKIDLVENRRLLEVSKFLNSEINFLETFMISAKKTYGIDFLIKRLIFNAPKSKWMFDNKIKTNKNLDFQISEITREKIFHFLNKEIPYSAEVKTRIESKKGIVYIYQDILVNKESQKSILIGKKGEKIKMIGSRSRLDIENLLNKKVFLNLIVKKK